MKVKFIKEYSINEKKYKKNDTINLYYPLAMELSKEGVIILIKPKEDTKKTTEGK